MGPMVSGSLRLTNGQLPNLFIETEGFAIVNEENIPYRSKLLGSHFIVEFQDPLRNENEVDEIFRVSKHIIDNMILSQVAIEGIGLFYTVEHCRKSNGDMVISIPDQSPKDESSILVFNDVLNIIGKYPDVRYAIRDLNSGLTDRENCPVYFYRCIETLAKFITGKVDEIGEDGWKDFHSRIGTKRDDMKILEGINKAHRHGHHSFFTKEQHLCMMKETRFFIRSVLNYLNTSRVTV
ncbi:MAG: hypothetical protein KGI27_02275 [Thaumarchaeota archaeon]|nr:hypothetical protein [Nitrososphaerota archaeon]